LDTEQEENRRIIEREKEEKKTEIQEMARKYQRELEDVRREADRSADLLNGIREQQGFTNRYFVVKNYLIFLDHLNHWPLDWKL
jgi:hypothetical protein